MTSDVHNKFEFQLIDKDGNVKQEAVGYNVVTNDYYTYLNKNQAVQFSTVLLGTGVGTPSVTDTAMFSQLASKSTGISSSNITFVDTNQFTNQMSITFNENEAIGAITEVGLYGNNRLYSHAMLTDAEGHTITVNKTDTDRLIITVTIYLTLQLPSNVLPFYGVGSGTFSYYGDQKRYKDSEVHYLVSHCLGCTSSRWSDQNAIGLALTKGGSAGSYAGGYDNNLNWSMSVSETSTGIRYQSSGRKLADAWNLPGTYQIRGLCTPIGYINMTADIFPPLSLTLSEVADGTQKGFNFKIPWLMSDVKVYINNELQSASSYTWNGTDYVNSFQAWESAQAEYVIVNPARYSNPSPYYNSFGTVLFNQNYHMSSGPTYSTNTIVLDFGTQKTFNRAYKPTASSSYSDWKYSNDNVNWTTLTIPSSSSNIYDFPTPITARYLKAENAIVNSSCWDNSWTPVRHSQLCCYKDQLVFNTAPPADAVIKIEAKSAYPIKNSNWILDQLVLDFSISRGT